MEKQIRRTFRWGTVIPMTLTAFSCILLFCNNVMPLTALAASAGALLLAAGVVRAVAFFLGQRIHVAKMLAGVVCVSVGLWALITCTDFSRSVLALGLGIALAVNAAAEGFGAWEMRKNRAALAVRILFAAGYAATGILLIVSAFLSVFPSSGAALVTAGAVMLFSCAEELVLLIAGGVFEEETLVYRRAPKDGGQL